MPKLICASIVAGFIACLYIYEPVCEYNNTIKGKGNGIKYEYKNQVFSQNNLGGCLEYIENKNQPESFCRERFSKWINSDPTYSFII